MTQPNPAAPGGTPPSRRESRGRLIGDGLSWTARWSLRLILTALGVSLVGIVIGQLWSIVLPVLLGLIIATVLEPPATWMRMHRVPPLLAALIVVVGALAVVGGVIAVIAPQVVAQVPQLVAGTTSGLDDVQRWLSTTFGLGQTQIGQVVQGAVDQLQNSATSIAGTVLTGLTTIASGVIDMVLALVLAFLFVKDGYRFLPWMRRQVGASAGTHLAEVGARAWDRLGGFIRSQAIVGFIDALCIGVGLVIIGVPLALPLAVLTFFGAFIPIVGALTAGALSVLIALVTGGLTQALIVLILILAVQQIEGNLLQPLVQGRGSGPARRGDHPGRDRRRQRRGHRRGVPRGARGRGHGRDRPLHQRTDRRPRPLRRGAPLGDGARPRGETAEDAVLLVAAGAPRVRGGGVQPVDGEEGTDAGSGATGTGTNGNGANGTGANGTGANGTGANGAIGRSPGSDRPPGPREATTTNE